MLKHIFAVPREFIQQLINEQSKPSNLFGDWALISIYSIHHGEIPLINSDTIPILNHIGCNRMLSTSFLDIKPEEFYIYQKEHLEVKEDFDLFNDSHAKQIIDFIKTIDESVLFVHCAAGISRSGAVSLFCNRFFELDESNFRKANKYIHPNSHILDVLHRCSGLDDDYLKFWEEELKKNDRIRKINFT
jgi:predicted protein tyrosine phosphatase